MRFICESGWEQLVFIWIDQLISLLWSTPQFDTLSNLLQVTWDHSLHHYSVHQFNSTCCNSLHPQKIRKVFQESELFPYQPTHLQLGGATQVPNWSWRRSVDWVQCSFSVVWLSLIKVRTLCAIIYMEMIAHGTRSRHPSLLIMSQHMVSCSLDCIQQVVTDTETINAPDPALPSLWKWVWLRRLESFYLDYT